VLNPENGSLIPDSNSKMRRTFLIDTDTASDDAVALIMALRAPDVRVAAITVVAGNVGVSQASRNALYVTELCGSEVPVFQGADRPLVREYMDAEWFHGHDGLGDQGYPAPKRSAARGHAVDAIVATINANPGIVLVTLGPLTNVALALAKEPTTVANVGRCVLMGGNPCCEGNVSPAAEYNVWADSEAARMVLRSGMPIELVGWHLCRGAAALNRHDIEHVLAMDSPLARFSIECNRTAMEAYRLQTGEVGISLPDPVAMAIAIDPAICTSRGEHFVDVELAGELTRGMTVVDRLGVARDDRNRDIWKPVIERGCKTTVCWTIDNPRWKKLLYAALSASAG
jgi:purine nucleosidase